MKKKILIGLAATAVITLVVFTATALAESPQDGGQNYWQQMQSACQTGNWQGMWDAMRGAQAAGYPGCPAVSGGTSGGGCGGGNIGTGATLY